MGYGLAFQLFYMEGSVPGRWSMPFLPLTLVWMLWKKGGELIKFAWHTCPFCFVEYVLKQSQVIRHQHLVTRHCSLICDTVLFYMQQFEDEMDSLQQKKTTTMFYFYYSPMVILCIYDHTASCTLQNRTHTIHNAPISCMWKEFSNIIKKTNSNCLQFLTADLNCLHPTQSIYLLAGQQRVESCVIRKTAP